MKKYLVVFLLAALFLGSYEMEAQSSYSVSYYRTGKTYKLNDLVSNNGVIYKALLATTSAPPHADWVDINSTGGGGVGNIVDGTGVGNINIWNGTTWVETTAMTSDDTDIFILNDLEVTGAITGSNLSGTNTGDQSTIVGLTGTKAQFDTAVTDGDILYVGDVTETDPVFVAEENDILKTNEIKIVTSELTFDEIPLMNATTAEIDAKGNLSAVNARWVFDNSAASPLTTKGDIFTFDTGGQRLGVGTNDFVLTADSAEPTGLKWAAATVIETDPVFGAEESNIAKLDGSQTFNSANYFNGGILTYNDINPIWEANDVANKNYIFENYAPLVEGSTAGEAFGVGKIVFAHTDGKWYLADNTTKTEVTGRIGLSFTASSGVDDTFDVTFDREVTTSGATAGGTVYLGTAGALTQTLPTGAGVWVRVVGTATSAINYHINTWSPSWTKADGSEVDGVAMASGDIGTIEINTLGTPTYTTLEDLINTNFSNGVINHGGAITDGGSGTINIASGSVMIRPTDSETATLYSADFPAVVGQALTDGVNNYIYISYNSGTPIIAVSTSVPSSNNNALIGIVLRSGTQVHISETHTPVSQFNQIASKRSALVDGVTRQSGSLTSETGTRNIAVTSGLWWLAFDEYTLGAIDTSVSDTFEYYYSDGGGGWTESDQTQIDNLQYDNGTGTLATLGNGKFGVHWVYKGVDNDTYVVYGTSSYSLTDANNASPPASVPPQVNVFHAALVAKIIIAKSAASFTSLQHPFDVSFGASVASSHLDLTDIGTNTHAQIDTHISTYPSPISNVVEDVTPQLGGDLDANGKDIDWPADNGNITGVEWAQMDFVGGQELLLGQGNVAVPAWDDTMGVSWKHPETGGFYNMYTNINATEPETTHWIGASVPTGGSYRFEEIWTDRLIADWAAMDDRELVSKDMVIDYVTGAGGSIGGSITDTQLAFGNTTANSIQGTANLTYDGEDIIIATAGADGGIKFGDGTGLGELRFDTATNLVILESSNDLKLQPDSGNTLVNGNLEVSSDPTTDLQVGDRGYNDLRYAALGSGGDVTKVGTPVNDQIAVWTGDGTVEGTDAFQFAADNMEIKSSSWHGMIGRDLSDNRRWAYESSSNNFGLRLYDGAGANMKTPWFSTYDEIVFNDGNGGIDVVINGSDSGNDHIFHADVVNNRIGLGTHIPTEVLDVRGNVAIVAGTLGGTITDPVDATGVGDRGYNDLRYAAIGGGGASTASSVWQFDTATTTSTPAAGDLKFNNATPASVTEIYFDDINNAGNDAAAYLGTLRRDDVIYIQTSADELEYLNATITSMTDNIGWWTAVVTMNNSGTLPAANDEMIIEMFSDGVTGTTGNQELLYGTANGQISSSSNVTYDLNEFEIITSGTSPTLRLTNTSASNPHVFTMDAGTSTSVDFINYPQSHGFANQFHIKNIHATAGIRFYAGGNNERMIIDNSGVEFLDDPVIPEEVYGVGWDASLEPATKNALYDKIELLSGGGMTDLIDDATPQLGGTLDVNTNNIYDDGGATWSVGNGQASTGVVGTGYINFFSNEPKIGSWDAADTFGEVSVKYDDFGGLRLKFNDNENGATGTLNFFGLGDGFIFEDVDVVNFDGAELQEARMHIGTYTTTDTVLTGEMNQTFHYTGASAGTITIPDTLTEPEGSWITIITEGAGTVTVACTGTATINGTTAGSIVISGQYKAVTLIQRVASSDDWIAIGAY